MLFLCFSKALSVRIWDLYLFYGFEILIHSSVSVLHVFSRMFLMYFAHHLGKLAKLSFDDAMYELSSCFEGDLGEHNIGRFQLIDAICRRSLSSFKRFRISSSTSLPIPSSVEEFVILNQDGTEESSLSGGEIP